EHVVQLEVALVAGRDEHAADAGSAAGAVQMGGRDGTGGRGGKRTVILATLAASAAPTAFYRPLPSSTVFYRLLPPSTALYRPASPPRRTQHHQDHQDQLRLRQRRPHDQRPIHGDEQQGNPRIQGDAEGSPRLAVAQAEQGK